MWMRRSRGEGAVLLGLLVFGGACREREPHREEVPTTGFASGPREHGAPASFVDLARAVDQSVVTVRSKARRSSGLQDLYPWIDEPPSRPASLGSGVILDADGTIVTNHHVIRGAEAILVALADGQEHPARVIGSDEETDIGILRIRAEGLVPARLGDSDRLEVGEWVVAIGNPFGLSHTVTAGIVSAKGRTARDVPSGPAKNYTWNFFQTDASINPGNSGGPLINVSGEVVGINTAIVARGAGIGFAIPINMVKELVPLLARDGHITRAWLGVFIHPVTADVAAKLGLASPRGALISDVVERGPAARAGIRRGDVILAFDGKDVDEKTLPFLASTAGVGRRVRLLLWRGGAEAQAEMVMERLPE
jgi:serine protease Do